MTALALLLHSLGIHVDMNMNYTAGSFLHSRKQSRWLLDELVATAPT